MDLIANDISHRFGALEVLDRVSFTVGAGEVVAIVGPSGCGKSTLLSILGGLLPPGAGGAEFRGAPSPRRAWRLRWPSCFRSVPFYPGARWRTFSTSRCCIPDWPVRSAARPSTMY